MRIQLLWGEIMTGIEMPSGDVLKPIFIMIIKKKDIFEYQSLHLDLDSFGHVLRRTLGVMSVEQNWPSPYHL